MTLKECYEKMGGNYDEVMARLRAEDRVTRFLVKFVSDPSYGELEAAIGEGRAVDAFRAAHTIKGVCLNLSLNRLFASASALTEALRDKTEIAADVAPLFEHLQLDYAETVNAINAINN